MANQRDNLRGGGIMTGSGAREIKRRITSM